MRRLYHHELSGLSRKVRIVLGEKRLDFDMHVQEEWVFDEEFRNLNPAGEVPVLIEPGGFVIAGCTPICEYLEDVYQTPNLLGTDPRIRAEVRRLCDWFDRKFVTEVTQPIVQEKLFRRMYGDGSLDSQYMRWGQQNLRDHLNYLTHLLEKRRWLACETFSLADISAAAQLSLIDYASDVLWKDYPHVKEWYALIKCRPSFRPLLDTWLPNVRPPRHYADLDF